MLRGLINIRESRASVARRTADENRCALSLTQMKTPLGFCKMLTRFLFSLEERRVELASSRADFASQRSQRTGGRVKRSPTTDHVRTNLYILLLQGKAGPSLHAHPCNGYGPSLASHAAWHAPNEPQLEGFKVLVHWTFTSGGQP